MRNTIGTTTTSAITVGDGAYMKSPAPWNKRPAATAAAGSRRVSGRARFAGRQALARVPRMGGVRLGPMQGPSRKQLGETRSWCREGERPLGGQGSPYPSSSGESARDQPLARRIRARGSHGYCRGREVALRLDHLLSSHSDTGLAFKLVKPALCNCLSAVSFPMVHSSPPKHRSAV